MNWLTFCALCLYVPMAVLVGVRIFVKTLFGERTIDIVTYLEGPLMMRLPRVHEFLVIIGLVFVEVAFVLGGFGLYYILESLV